MKLGNWQAKSGENYYLLLSVSICSCVHWLAIIVRILVNIVWKKEIPGAPVCSESLAICILT